MGRRQPSQRQPLRAGFSLIELLMVLGIVVILFGLALPVVNGSFARARSTGRLSGVQQVNQVIQIYTDDFKECFPVAAYDHAITAAMRFYEPLLAGGYLASLDVLGTSTRYAPGMPNITMTSCVAYDADRMQPGRTEPESQWRTHKVTTSQIMWPSALGLVRSIVVNDGRGEILWCCGAECPAGAVGFCDGSTGEYKWQQLIPTAAHYVENSVGIPATSTWGGYRGRDKQR